MLLKREIISHKLLPLGLFEPEDTVGDFPMGLDKASHEKKSLVHHLLAFRPTHKALDVEPHLILTGFYLSFTCAYWRTEFLTTPSHKLWEIVMFEYCAYSSSWSQNWRILPMSVSLCMVYEQGYCKTLCRPLWCWIQKWSRQMMIYSFLPPWIQSWCILWESVITFDSKLTDHFSSAEAVLAYDSASHDPFYKDTCLPDPYMLPVTFSQRLYNLCRWNKQESRAQSFGPLWLLSPLLGLSPVMQNTVISGFNMCTPSDVHAPDTATSLSCWTIESTAITAFQRSGDLDPCPGAMVWARLPHSQSE